MVKNESSNLSRAPLTTNKGTVMHIYTCANKTCGKIFTPSKNPRENFGKYCSRDCSKACIVPDYRGAKGRNVPPPPPTPRTHNWRDLVKPHTKVYLDQNTSMVFEVVHAERNIAWLKIHHVYPHHEHLSNLNTCWCEGEKLVTLSRCDLVNPNPNWKVL